jgi:hypothetical protein
MKLSDTVDMMNSTDFKERFRAEYFQLSNRVDGLSSMLEKYRKGTLTFTPKCSLKLLDNQLNSMIIYKTHLKERANIEGISLDETVTPIPSSTNPGESSDEQTTAGTSPTDPKSGTTNNK